jgi:hypothetical protein
MKYFLIIVFFIIFEVACGGGGGASVNNLGNASVTTNLVTLLNSAIGSSAGALIAAF